MMLLIVLFSAVTGYKLHGLVDDWQAHKRREHCRRVGYHVSANMCRECGYEWKARLSDAAGDR